MGLITDPHQAEAILVEGRADLIAIARQALYEPYWPHHAASTLDFDPGYEIWPKQYGWWLAGRARTCDLYQSGASGVAAE